MIECKLGEIEMSIRDMKKKKYGIIIALIILCSFTACSNTAPDGDALSGEVYEPIEGNKNEENTEEASLPESGGVENSGAEDKEADFGKTDISKLEGIIEEQTFDVTLDGWGDVTFASFLPEERGGGEEWGDVQFRFLKDGETVYSLPGWNEKNALIDQRFEQIVEIGFQDFDDDGRTDIITICEYALLADPSIDTSCNEVRVYTQKEGEKEFAIDGFVCEFLMKQRYTDSIATIMAAKEEYKDYMESMDGSRSVDAQLGIMADNMDMWFGNPDYANDLYCYAVTDLDVNGRYELIVANCGGTGNYTYSHFFEVNKSYDGLTECETNFVEGDSQPDIIEDFITVYVDEEGVFHYIFNDYLRLGAAENYLITSAITLQNGKITSEPLRRMKTIYDEEKGGIITYADGAGNEITGQDYINTVENAFEGLRSYTVSFGWQEVKELKDLGREEIVQKLAESYYKCEYTE